MCSFQGHEKTRNVEIAKSPKIGNVFNPHKSFPGRQLNAALRLEIQASSVAKRRTLLNRKFVCIKVLRCSNIT